MSVLDDQGKRGNVGIGIVGVTGFAKLKSVESGSCVGVGCGQTEVCVRLSEDDLERVEGEELSGIVGNVEVKCCFEVFGENALAQFDHFAVVTLLDGDDLLRKGSQREERVSD